jgi:hypothetical protein
VASVFVQNPDLQRSGIVAFVIVFPYPAGALQCWTTVEAVCAEVPSFRRGGRIGDAAIETWIRSIAQSIAGLMMRRGLSLNSSDWQQPDPGTLLPTPSGVLELINRLGAAARLAGAMAADVSAGEWGLTKALQRDYERELGALRDGQYDKLFRPAAATVESGTLVAGGDMTDDSGEVERAFEKGQVF